MNRVVVRVRIVGRRRHGPVGEHAAWRRRTPPTRGLCVGELDSHCRTSRPSLCGDEDDRPVAGKRECLVPVFDPAGFGEQPGVVGTERDDDNVAERPGIGPQTEQFES